MKANDVSLSLHKVMACDRIHSVMRYSKQSTAITPEKYQAYKLTIKAALEKQEVSEEKVISLLSMLDRIGRNDLLEFLDSVTLFAKILPLDDDQLMTSRQAVKKGKLCSTCGDKLRYRYCNACKTWEEH